MVKSAYYKAVSLCIRFHHSHCVKYLFQITRAPLSHNPLSVALVFSPNYSMVHLLHSQDPVHPLQLQLLFPIHFLPAQIQHQSMQQILFHQTQRHIHLGKSSCVQRPVCKPHRLWQTNFHHQFQSLFHSPQAL